MVFQLGDDASTGMNEINLIPLIDIMLVLMIIFGDGNGNQSQCAAKFAQNLSTSQWSPAQSDTSKHW